MSESDVPPDEMRRFSEMRDGDIERLFAGQAPDGDADLGEIARFFQDFDEACPEASTEVHEAAHIAAMMETAQLLAENGEPAARPASKAHGPESQVSGLPKRRRKVMLKAMLRHVLASTKAKAAVAALALVMAFGGTAFAATRGVLPAPVQDAAADVAAEVGIDLPRSTDAIAADAADLDDADANDLEQADVNDTDDADDAEDADENDVDESAVDDEDDDGDQESADEQDADSTDGAGVSNDEGDDGAAEASGGGSGGGDSGESDGGSDSGDSGESDGGGED